ncbi:hypothetical protein [Nocardia flavorosea]|uniref:hypothetical protein n=1 Tax=Nocardia flavorosea TaxID=53429 RepID=UPI0007A3E590|nr:hypothetical protein [Nocardia flavorosea]
MMVIDTPAGRQLRREPAGPESCESRKNCGATPDGGRGRRHAEFTLEYVADPLTERGIDWLITGSEESIRSVKPSVSAGWIAM